MIVAARGVQIYECRVRKDAGAGYEWAFVAPEAELFDAKGNAIGRHGAGPTWQATDGSRIVGTLPIGLTFRNSKSSDRKISLRIAGLQAIISFPKQ